MYFHSMLLEDVVDIIMASLDTLGMKELHFGCNLKIVSILGFADFKCVSCPKHAFHVSDLRGTCAAGGRRRM
jgi:hypothetical protein